ncbi:unnamed protein product [Closterium sp. NIES-54]
MKLNYKGFNSTSYLFSMAITGLILSVIGAAVTFVGRKPAMAINAIRIQMYISFLYNQLHLVVNAQPFPSPHLCTRALRPLPSGLCLPADDVYAALQPRCYSQARQLSSERLLPRALRLSLSSSQPFPFTLAPFPFPTALSPLPVPPTP